MPHTPKGTPKDWVDALLRDGARNWVPPIPTLVPIARDLLVSKSEWADAYNALLDHHCKETDLLNAVIRELVERLKKSQT